MFAPRIRYVNPDEIIKKRGKSGLAPPYSGFFLRFSRRARRLPPPAAPRAVFVKSREKRSEQRFSRDKAFNRGFWVNVRGIGAKLAFAPFRSCKSALLGAILPLHLPPGRQKEKGKNTAACAVPAAVFPSYVFTRAGTHGELRPPPRCPPFSYFRAPRPAPAANGR
jgi:hypothetical protein